MRHRRSPSGHKSVGSARPFDDVDDAEVPIVNALLEVILPGVDPDLPLQTGQPRLSKR